MAKKRAEFLVPLFSIGDGQRSDTLSTHRTINFGLKLKVSNQADESFWHYKKFSKLFLKKIFFCIIFYIHEDQSTFIPAYLQQT